ncbi:MAG: hypothetical protein ACYDBB_21935 [Armatimonadota bacterium]
MLAEEKPGAIFGIVVGLTTQLISVISLRVYHFMPPTISTAIYFCGWFLLIWGCAAYARGKGYTPLLAALGLLSFIGPLLIALLPDRRRS